MAVYLGQNEVILRNGISTLDATAIASDILIGKTAYVNDIKITGTHTDPIEKDVNFYDYDGTLVIGYTIAEAQVLTTLPFAPVHSDLTFQEWNYTLEEVNATTSPLDIGATYITTDGKSHFYITLTAVSGLSPTFYFNKSDTSELTIDYGDGTTATSSASGNINFTHTYATIGNYIVKTWLSSGVGTYGFGNGTSSTVVVGGATAVYRQTLTKCYIGTSVITLTSNAFYSCYALKYLVIPKSITAFETGGSACINCFSLVFVTIPNVITNIIGYTFSGCYILRVSLPTSVTNLDTYAFSSCYNFSSVVIPYGVTSIGSRAFSGAWMIEKYILQPTTPPTLVSTQSIQATSICKILVPVASLTAYQTAINWSTFASYMEGY